MIISKSVEMLMRVLIPIIKETCYTHRPECPQADADVPDVILDADALTDADVLANKYLI
tara:strand:+ start:216 stop:392 length:177 start_codon:yes stop_codon:yes gene_type:complete